VRRGAVRCGAMRCDAMRCDGGTAICTPRRYFWFRCGADSNANVRDRGLKPGCEGSSHRVKGAKQPHRLNRRRWRGACVRVRGYAFARSPLFAVPINSHVTPTGLEGRAARGRGAQDPEPRERHSAVRSTSQTVQATSSTRRTQGTRRVLRHLRRCVGTNPFRVSARRRLSPPTERGASAGFGG
jgi:hypothetical protein